MTENQPVGDSQTVILTRHVERLRGLVLRYHDWFHTDNHAEAVAILIADARLLLNDLKADPDEVERFVTAWNLRRAVPHPDEIEVPEIVCETSLDDLTAGDGD